MRRRVVITGAGMVTPLGHTVEGVWRAMLESKSGVAPITLFDASTFPTKIAAEVKDFDLAQYTEDPDRWEYSGRNTRFAVGAAHAEER